MAEGFELQSAMLAFHVGANSNPGCSISNPAPYQCAGESSGRCPSATHGKHVDETPDSSLKPDPVPAIASIWGDS